MGISGAYAYVETVKPLLSDMTVEESTVLKTNDQSVIIKHVLYLDY